MCLFCFAQTEPFSLAGRSAWSRPGYQEAESDAAPSDEPGETLVDEMDVAEPRVEPDL